MKFKDYLVEIMSLQPRPDFNDYRVGTHDKYVYDFQHKEHNFSMLFERDDPESMDGPQTIWNASYTYRKAPGQSSYSMQHFNDASSFGILSIAFSYIAMFTETLAPDEIYFSADKGDGNRASVYQRIMKRLMPDLRKAGYGYVIEDRKYQHAFVIRKKEFLENNPDAVM